jgi:ribosomal protein L30/L7E
VTSDEAARGLISRSVRYVPLVVVTLVSLLAGVWIGMLIEAAWARDPNLEHRIRYTGALLAVVASFLAAPSATWHLWEIGPRRLAITTGRVVDIGIRTGTAQVKRAREWFRGHGRGRGSSAQAGGQASLGATSSATETGKHVFAVETGAPLAERVRQLEQHIKTLGELHEMNKQAIAEQKDSLAGMVRNVEHKVEQEAAAIRSKIAKMERNALIVDSRALPAIGLGILLTSIPDLIARSAVLTGLLIVVGVALLAWAWPVFWASRPANQTS